jgi:ribonuclease G
LLEHCSIEWLVEQGIGEDRALLVENGQVRAARLDWPGQLSPGQIENAALISRRAGSKRGTARFASGEEALVDALPSDAAEGAKIRLVVTRSAIAETGRHKLAHTRPTQEVPRPAPSLAERLGGSRYDVRVVRHFPSGDWPEIIAEALDGIVPFAGGSLAISPTPAMTLIDIDGDLPPPQLSLAAIPALAGAIGRFDLAGSIGIDFPGIERKDERRKVDQALATALADWPHESTAMNGFGLVQLVARLERPSIIQRIRQGRAGAAARLLLRQAELVEAPGALLLTAHPAVRAATGPEWEAELARRSGRAIHWQADPALALNGSFAQAITP